MEFHVVWYCNKNVLYRAPLFMAFLHAAIFTLFDTDRTPTYDKQNDRWAEQ